MLYARCASHLAESLFQTHSRACLLYTSIAQENIWLETDTLGLGGVWFGIAPIEEHMEEVHRLLGLPENVKVFSMFALGYPAETRPQQDRFDPERIHFIEE